MGHRTDDFPEQGGVSQPYYVVGQDIFYTVKLSKYMKGRIPTGTIKISVIIIIGMRYFTTALAKRIVKLIPF